MSYTHKYDCHKQLHTLVDSTDFKAVLENLFDSPLGSYHMKEIDGIVFFYNTKISKSLFGDTIYNRFSACKRYSVNQTLSYEVLLDENFKDADGFVDRDWTGYDFDDLLNEVKRIVFKM